MNVLSCPTPEPAPVVYHGGQWLDVELPTHAEPWPRFETRRTTGTRGEPYDATREDVRSYVQTKPWVVSSQTLHFLCDVHADADAFLRSLVASGGVALTGPGVTDFEVTPHGRRAQYVIGGDCFDKGPHNLRLLRTIRAARNAGAAIELLAGNHDLRTLVGLSYVGQKDPRFAHLFVRMGKKAVPLLKEVLDDCGPGPDDVPPEAEIRSLLFPDESWYESFPQAVGDLIPPKKLAKEVVRIREKVAEFEPACHALGLCLRDVYRAVRLATGMFLHPQGEFHWFFTDMKLARRHGSFLLIHAGLDDVTAQVLRDEGVDALNRWFRQMLQDDPFELYHGPLGNTFRTKYRDIDYPLSEKGGRNVQAAGVYAIVHGHRNILRGQRIVLRRGILNFECDASIDANTRRIEGLHGPGGAVTTFCPDGRVLGISTDCPHIKVFDLPTVADMVTFI